MAKNSEGEKTGGEGASSKAPEPPAAAPGGPSKPVGPPLVVAGRRLERLLGGGYAAAFSSSSSPPSVAAPASPAARASPAATLASAVEAVLHSNPPKIVRRWLGTSSGTATAATLSDVVQAAQTLLDPEGVAARGRSILEALSTEEEVGEGAAMDVDAGDDGTKEAGEGRGGKSAPAFLKAAAREVEAYLLSLAIRILLQKDASQAWSVSTESLSILTGHMDRAAKITALAGAAGALGGDSASGSKGLEPLLARLFRYRCLVAAKLVGGGKMQLDAEALRSELITAYRLACLRRDVDTQSTVLNLILQELLNADQIEQAHKLLSNSTFPDAASNNQLCRYLYHSGRIQALRLEYTSAFSNLSQCLRKAPTNTGLGFRIATQRLLVVVQLLMGEIPERTDFLAEGMTVELKPYMKISQAVRRGDLAVFHETASAFADRFREDGTFTLISRLAHSVVKAGLRHLNISYSRIGLADVAKRLGLPSVESAEFVVAKAVRDGVIDATIDHEGKYIQSHDLVDVYATTEPAEAFHRRIAYCLTMHNDAVRGMRYPPDAYKKQLEASRGNRGGGDDEDKTDEEKAAELEDELEEDY